MKASVFVFFFFNILFWAVKIKTKKYRTLNYNTQFFIGKVGTNQFSTFGLLIREISVQKCLNSNVHCFFEIILCGLN